MRQKGGAPQRTRGAEPHVRSVDQRSAEAQGRAVFFSAGTDRRLADGFTQIPNAILRATEISAGAKVLYGLLISYAWQTTICWPNQTTLAEDAGCSVRNVRRWLQELEVACLVRIHQRGLNRPNLYEILPLPLLREASHPDGTDLSGPDGTGLSGQDRTPVSAKEDSPGEEHPPEQEDPEDNNNARARTQEEVPTDPVVVSTASPREREHDTVERAALGASAPDGAPNAHRAGRGTATALRELLARVPDISQETARQIVGTHGVAAVHEHLAWLQAEQESLLARHQPAIEAPGGWLRRSFTWVRPPASYRRKEQQAERSRRSEQMGAAAAERRAARDADLATEAAQLAAAIAWFSDLPAAGQADVDARIRAELASLVALQATGIPPVPEVLTGGRIAASLWRERLTALWQEEGGPQVISAACNSGPQPTPSEDTSAI